jgi:hypothetical protein
MSDLVRSTRRLGGGPRGPRRSVATAADDPDVPACIAATTALALTTAGEGEVDEDGSGSAPSSAG